MTVPFQGAIAVGAAERRNDCGPIIRKTSLVVTDFVPVALSGFELAAHPSDEGTQSSNHLAPPACKSHSALGRRFVFVDTPFHDVSQTDSHPL